MGEDGEVRLYEPLSKHTTLRVGGPAQFWVEPRNEKAFAELIRFCRRRKSSAFRDRSRIKSCSCATAAFAAWSFIRAVASSTRSKLTATKSPRALGAKLKEVAYAGKAAGLGGLEWMEGIPGAVGGGLRMNAGAMGAQTFDNVVSVRYLDAKAKSHTKTRDELEVFYRHFPLLEKNFAVSAVFRGAACAA